MISVQNISFVLRYTLHWLFFLFSKLTSFQAMEEIHKLRAQISNIVQSNFPGIDSNFDPKLKPPSDKQLKILRQLLAAAFIDQVAVRKDRVQNSSISGVQFASTKGVPYRALGVQEDVFIHPSSILASNAPPEYIIFSEIIRTSKPWMKGKQVSAVDIQTKLIQRTLSQALLPSTPPGYHLWGRTRICVHSLNLQRTARAL